MNKIYLLFCIALFSSCDNENIEINKQSNEKTLNVNDFEYLGETHNSFLSNVYYNLEVNEKLENTTSKIEHINEFNIEYVDKTNLSSNEKNELKKSLVENKFLTKESYLVEKIKISRTSEEDLNIEESINLLHKSKLISNEAYDILIDFSAKLQDNYEGTLSNEDLKFSIKELTNNFNASNFSQNSDGVLVGSVLAISISSIEWWEGNVNALDGLTARNQKSPKLTSIAPWLAADLVGALWGGATGAIASYVGTGEINWTATGVGALSGAVSGSTGAIGKIAKWLF